MADGVIRDFTVKTINRTIELIQLNEEEEQCFLLDWIDDELLEVEPTIQEYMYNIDKYHEAIIDKHNLGLQEFNRIVEEVFEIDANYAKRYEALYDNMVSFQKKIESLTTMFTQSKMTMDGESYREALKKINEEYTSEVSIYNQELQKFQDCLGEADHDYAWYETFWSGFEGFFGWMLQEAPKGLLYIDDYVWGTNWSGEYNNWSESVLDYIRAKNLTDLEAFNFVNGWTDKIEDFLCAGVLEAGELYVEGWVWIPYALSDFVFGTTFNQDLENCFEGVDLKGSEMLDLDREVFSTAEKVVDIAVLIYASYQLVKGGITVVKYASKNQLWSKLSKFVKGIKFTPGYEVALADGSTEKVASSLEYDKEALAELKALFSKMFGKGSATINGKVYEYTEYTDDMRQYIIPPEGMEGGYQAYLERQYIEIRKLGMDDVTIVAENTGLSEDVVATMKKHLFLDTHELSVKGADYTTQYF